MRIHGVNGEIELDVCLADADLRNESLVRYISKENSLIMLATVKAYSGSAEAIGFIERAFDLPRGVAVDIVYGINRALKESGPTL